MMLLMCNLASSMETAGELASPGQSSLSLPAVMRTQCVSVFCGRMLQMKLA
jgi:hypothetical protein